MFSPQQKNNGYLNSSIRLAFALILHGCRQLGQVRGELIGGGFHRGPLGLSSLCSGVMPSLGPPGAPQGPGR